MGTPRERRTKTRPTTNEKWWCPDALVRHLSAIVSPAKNDLPGYADPDPIYSILCLSWACTVLSYLYRY